MDELCITIKVTSEQRDTIKALFMHNDWEYVELKTTCNQGTSKQLKRKIASKPGSYDHIDQNDGVSAINVEGIPQCPIVPLVNVDARPQNPDTHFVEIYMRDGECPHCFQSPCVTQRNFSWVGNGQVACDANSGIRCKKYRQFWHVISNLGGWYDPRYINTKVERANGGKWAIVHRREVMPICVLRHLRTMYPNPKEKSYMDHKWN